MPLEVVLARYRGRTEPISLNPIPCFLCFDEFIESFLAPQVHCDIAACLVVGGDMICMYVRLGGIKRDEWTCGDVDGWCW